jgi:NAD(P)H-nitrite reductase large subunit
VGRLRRVRPQGGIGDIAEPVVRFLANIQRNGTFSVVPRIPGGEIHPDKLVAIGKIAKEYGLYTKITGGTWFYLIDTITIQETA